MKKENWNKTYDLVANLYSPKSLYVEQFCWENFIDTEPFVVVIIQFYLRVFQHTCTLFSLFESHTKLTKKNNNNNFTTDVLLNFMYVRRCNESAFLKKILFSIKRKCIKIAPSISFMKIAHYTSRFTINYPRCIFIKCSEFSMSNNKSDFSTTQHHHTQTKKKKKNFLF